VGDCLVPKMGFGAMMYGRSVARSEPPASTITTLVWNLLLSSNESIMARSILRRTTSKTCAYCSPPKCPCDRGSANHDMYCVNVAFDAFSISPDSTAVMISEICA
jgi:hypothetical protein